MRRLSILIVAILIFATAMYAGDPLNVTEIENLAKKEAEKQFEPVIDLFGSALNTGIYAPVSGKLLTIGLQGNFVPIKKEGILSDADVSVVLLPFLYAGVRIPGIGIDLLARGVAVPISGKTAKVLGFGAGWEPSLVPIINTKLILTYHTINDFPYLSVKSFGGNIIAAFTKLPFVTPFATFGFNSTTIETEVSVLNETAKFSMSKSKFQMSVGAKLLFVVLEAGIVPANTISVSAGISF